MLGEAPAEELSGDEESRDPAIGLAEPSRLLGRALRGPVVDRGAENASGMVVGTGVEDHRVHRLEHALNGAGRASGVGQIVQQIVPVGDGEDDALRA
mgnify:FL=1